MCNHHKQAVVVIHGMGEQRPMSTLRNFVEALAGSDYRSKPDRLSESFELRRLDYDYKKDPKKKDSEKKTTHFYEYYWAYRMRETRFTHLLAWMARLFFSPWRDCRRCFLDLRTVPPQHSRLFSLFLTIGLLLLVVLAVGVLIACGAVPGRPTLIFLSVSVLGIVLVRLLHAWFSNIVLNSVGDAARYLNSSPTNIGERHAIRADGIALLRKLHDPARGYERIVIVGHSLGSAIAYDMLKHYWAEVNNNMPIIPGSCASTLLNGVESPGQTPEAFQDRQYCLWKELATHPSDAPQSPRWLVSDFVTLGSPLSYGAFLLAESSQDFKSRVAQRELPVCPPISNGIGDIKRPKSFAWEDEKTGNLYLHHAAPFSLTRWTNLYFPGDPIAGKLAGVFSSCGVPEETETCRKPGIRDIRLEDGPSWLKFRSHTWYWQATRSFTCVESLKEIIKLKLEECKCTVYNGVC